MPIPKSTKEILEKYSRKLESEISLEPTQSSREYTKFKQEMVPILSSYEKLAKSLGNIIRVKISEKDKNKIKNDLTIAHLDVTPEEALTLSIFSMLGIFFCTILVFIALYLINNSTQLLLLFLGVLASILAFYYAYTMPKRLANQWRLQASSQMVPAILYMVIYMKHTSNIERAIHFASEHLEGPLALDFKKILYNVEIGKFSTIKQSLDSYLETWRVYAPEFIESIHLIESSLFEPLESRRIAVLEKSLQVILDGVYEKMLKYSREIRSPLTNVYMLGIILPTLGLALLPLASTLLGGILKWYHVFVIFNILIPFFVFYLVNEILLKRPGGYGETKILELNPNYHLFISKKPWIKAALIAIILFLIGLVPFIFQINAITSPLKLKSDYFLGEIGIPFMKETKLFEFKKVEGAIVGPFSPFSIILSLFITLSLTLFFSIAYKQKTASLIKSREETKKIEEEFTNSIFQLGNRLGDGIPAEIAFGQVTETTRNQATSDFFTIVNQNIQQGGMSVEKAIFDEKQGAIILFPSAIIATSMRILIEATKKGLQVAASSLMAISDYIKNINKINQRLKDLLAEIITDMKSNMVFLAPLLAGIVVGLYSMITTILNKLGLFQQEITSGSATSIAGLPAGLINMFQIELMVPPYFIQICIGLYLIEITFILTSALVTVESGKDSLKEKYELALNLRRGIILYLITSLISIMALTLLSTIALGSLTA